jgi:acetoin utilization protein AcuB
MIVDMCMTRSVETVTLETTLTEAVHRMNARNIRRLVVVKNRAILGVLCKQDIVRAFPPDLNPFSVVSIDGLPSLGTVTDVLHRPAIVIEADQPIEAAARRMTEHHIGGLPVVQGDKLVGIITESDIFRVFSKLLSGKPGSTRITFDITNQAYALGSWVRLCEELKLELTSLITFTDGARRLAVARVQGANTHRLIDRLWDSGQSVINVVD